VGGFRNTKTKAIEAARSISTAPGRDASPRNLLGFPNNSPVPIYTSGWREALWELSVCLAQEHNTVSPARARTRTAYSGNERTDH